MYARLFYCGHCNQRRYPGDCAHFRTEGPTKVKPSLVKELCKDCSKSMKLCSCHEKARLRREVAREVEAAGLTGAWMPDVKVLEQTVDTISQQQHVSPARTTPARDWIVWGFLAVNARRLAIENRAWVTTKVDLKNLIPNMPELLAYYAVDSGAQCEAVGVFKLKEADGGVYGLTKLKGGKKHTYVQSCLLKPFEGLNLSLVTSRAAVTDDELVIVARNKFGGVMGLTTSYRVGDEAQLERIDK